MDKPFSEWYVEVIQKSGLAEHSPVRGCMTIKPYGWAIWENMQRILDQAIKDTGHVNAYFPLFIPLSFLAREAQHVEGFAQECAVVTHYRIQTDPLTRQVRPDPQAELEEPLVVRPTSETIIWNTYKNWIRSYRDLPILINQWANVVRWEKRPRLFLRTTEFLWQEGHTAHATAEEALQEAHKMLEVYATFAETQLAIPVIRGTKTPIERFAGAEETFTIESLMQDGKALQMGTSHFLGQNFAKAFDVKFLNPKNQLEYVWATSWGVSTRLLGAVIMSHGDSKGLILPPAIAPIQVILIPILGTDQDALILETLHKLKQTLQSQKVRTHLDSDPHKRPGWKFNEWELKGVPLRITLGPRDLSQNQAEITSRLGEKTFLSLDAIPTEIPPLLDAFQKRLFQRAQERIQAQTHWVNTWEEFQEVLKEKGGFLVAHWDGEAQTELAIKERSGATIRCIPWQPIGPQETGRCILTGRPSKQRVLFAQAY